MDPSRTLVAFLLETDPSVATVHLLGSWDNFSSSYPMDRDSRRGRGHWRGCHSLQDHVCDGYGAGAGRKHTGLAMGHTYYYYYELNGSTEICNPAMPSTTSCPYLPGQKVNTLYIPREATSRSRRASLTSLSQEQFRTMDPRSKFVTPKPAAPSYADLSIRRTGTAPAPLHTDIALVRDGPSSTTSPIRSPWRRFFNKTLISRSLESRDRLTNHHEHRSLKSASSIHDARPQSPSEEPRTRDISPASLRRLLVEEPDTSMRPVTRGSIGPPSRPRSPAHDVIDHLDEEDDDNFVGTADAFSLNTSEEPLFTTRLSPPPFRRHTLLATERSSSAHTVVPSSLSRPSSLQRDECALAGLMISPMPQHAPQLSILESLALSVQDSCASSGCPSSTLSSAMNSPASPTSAGFPTLCEIPTSPFLSFYDESHQGDGDIDQHLSLPGHDDVPAAQGSAPRISNHVKEPSTASFSRYRLPPLALSTDKPPAAESGESANLLGPNFLASSLVGLDDFGHELSWIADSITGRRQN